MSDSKTSDSEYDDISEEYGEFYQSRLGQIYLSVTLDQITRYAADFPEKIDILDLGCGKCTVARELTSKFDVRKVTAIDSSQGMVTEARSFLNETDIRGFSVHHGDITSFNYQGKYDIVLAQGGVMSHLKNPYDIFDITAKTLADNGYAFVSAITSYRYAVFSLWEGNWGRFKRCIEDNELETSDGIKIRTQNVDQVKSHLRKKDAIELTEIYPKVNYLGYIPARRQKEVLDNHWDKIKALEIEAAQNGDNDHGLLTEIVLRRPTNEN